MDFTHCSILLKLNDLYPKVKNDPVKLYEATRGRWKVGLRRYKVQLAMSVYEGEIREVYEVECWFPAGMVQQKVEVHVDPPGDKRWEFTGKVASEPTRSKYLGESVHDLMSGRFVFRYVGC